MRESNPNSRLTIGGILNIRRTLVLAFGAGALTVSVGGFAQPTKTVKIGVAIDGTAAGTKIMVDAFRQGLRDLGYVEGRNALIVYGYTEGVAERGAQIAKQIIESNPDVIVVSSTGLAATFNDATSKIPIVVGAAGNLVRAGLASSLARPGGNVTGSAGMAPDLAAKRLEMLKEIVPGLSRLGIVWHGSRGFSDEPEARELQAAAQKLGITVQPAEVRDVRDFRSPYASLVAQKADAIVIIQGTFTDRYNKELSELAFKNRLPSVCEGSQWAQNGCLICFGPDRTVSLRRAAAYVDKILNGAKPGDLPIEQPTKLELVINLKTAQTLGVKIPSSILVRADKVIE